MAELLTHVLVAFILLRVASWRYDWLTPKWITLGMVGALFPDLNRIDMILDSDVVEAVLGIPWGWSAIHTLGGVLLLSACGALLFTDRSKQLRAFGLMLVGAISHLALDAVKMWADGYNGVYLYPITWWRNPTPGWYVSADRWLLVVAIALTVVVVVIEYARDYRTEH